MSQTPHKDDPRALQTDDEGLPIPAYKLTVRDAELTGVLVTVGATVEVEDLELRGRVVRLQVKKTAGSASNYSVQVLTRDPDSTPAPHDFDDVYPTTSHAVASDPVDENVDKVYENRDGDGGPRKRSLYVKIIPDDSATPNDFDIRLSVEQMV